MVKSESHLKVGRGWGMTLENQSQLAATITAGTFSSMALECGRILQILYFSFVVLCSKSFSP